MLKKTVVGSLISFILLASCAGSMHQNIVSPENNKEITTTEITITQEDAPTYTHEQEKIIVDNKSACPNNMIEIEGDYCTNLEEICLKYGDPGNKGANGPVQCLEFKSPTRCLSATIHVHYCIDKYPYPNKPEEKPMTNLSWYQAKNLCEADGKRLCNMKEFTQACRGPNNHPYPYADGYHRDCSKCNCDRVPWVNPATHPFSEVDKRVEMGSLPDCKSDYGVMDMVGNNDRFVYNETERPYKSGLMGGHAVLGARNRCSPVTIAHNESFSYYETGTVCCKDIK